MQVTATIKEVKAVDQTINVVVFYQDDQGGQRNEVLNFQNGATVTTQNVIDEITRKAIAKAQVGVSEATLKALLTLPPIIVTDKTSPPAQAAAVAAAAAVKGG